MKIYGVIPPEYQNVTDTNVGKMTEQEAIRELTVFELYQEEGVETYIPFGFLDALRMAIEALQFKQTMVDSMKSMNDILALQSENGNWNYDAYNLGLYNGIELMMSILEDRECMYRELKAEG